MSTNANAPSFPAWLAQEERVTERAPVDITATISSIKHGAASARLVDLSYLGFRARLDQPLTVGSIVSITIAGFAPIDGWIAWQRDGEHGIDFAHAMPHPVAHAIWTKSTHHAS